MESYSDILLYVNILDFQEIFKTHICKGKEHCHIFNVESIVEDHPITLHTYFVEDHPITLQTYFVEDHPITFQTHFKGTIQSHSRHILRRPSNHIPDTF